jgi:hypothetical protein
MSVILDFTLRVEVMLTQLINKRCETALLSGILLAFCANCLGLACRLKTPTQPHSTRGETHYWVVVPLRRF